MNNKVNSKIVEEINNNILGSIKDTENKLNSCLSRSFYFKGRKSVEIAKNIIQSLSEKNDLVLDPFLGGGSFLLACLETERKLYGIELDNYTFFALSMIFSKFDSQKLYAQFDQISVSIKNMVLELYKTKCCDSPNFIEKVFFDPNDNEYFNPQYNRDIIEGKNIHLLNKCPVCGSKYKHFDDFDLKVLEDTYTLNVQDFPKNKLIENSRINITTTTGADKYDKAFNIRNQYALLLIQQEISKLEDSPESRMLQHILVNTLPLAKISMYGSGTDNLYHIILEKGQDTNVWYLFENKYNQFIKFKNQYNRFLVNDIEDNHLFKILEGDYYERLCKLDIKFDLIYTDFPYTDQIPYLERNQLFRVWLEKFVDKEHFKLSSKHLDNEIVQTNAPSRPNKSSIDSYYNDIDKMFNILSKRIKDNKFAVFTIKLGNNRYLQTYSKIVSLARKNGFEYITRIALNNNNPTLRKQSAYANTLQKEQIVVFQKLSTQDSYLYINDTNYDYICTKIVYKAISKDYSTKIDLSKAVNLILAHLQENDYIPDANEISKIKQIVSSNFIINENSVLSIDSNRLYINIEDQQTIFLKLYDIIPIYIKELINDYQSFVIEDLYLKLTSILCESDHSTLSIILNDAGYQSQIKSLLNSYCEISNGKYTKRILENNAYSGSKDISQFSGSEFEELIKILLEREGFINVIVRGGAGDRGVDIVASKLINKTIYRYFIQCKRWASNVGSEPMQRLYAERELHNADYAICITTSDFTKDGKDAASQFQIELWSGVEVLKLLNKHFPKKYYNTLLLNS